MVVVDEFQDTSADEWAMVRQLGAASRVIALGDPDQRIYEFRGADPNRLNEFIGAFGPLSLAFEGDSHRSAGTDIATFGVDLLTGRNKGAEYQAVKVVEYGFYYGRNPHYAAKTQLMQAIKRVRAEPSWSVALLVPSKAFMLQVSDYLTSTADGLPTIRHDVALDAEPPALAATVIATLLEGGAPDLLTARLLDALHTHIRGRGGSKQPTESELDLADAIGTYLGSGKVRGKKRQALVDECARIAHERGGLVLSGNPEADWLAVRGLLAGAGAEHLSRVADDAKFLRLLHRGSGLRTALTDLWQSHGGYVGANQAVRNALVQEHFTAALKEWRGVHLMTIHKAKGKEFDEVVVYEGRYSGRIVADSADAARQAQSRLALRVAVTRAMRRATIVTPKDARCPLV